MCGIAGIVHGQIHPIVEKLQHRGPDNTGLLYNTYVDFGHTRLSILDLSEKGNQPMRSVTSDRYVLTYNGEIYNYEPGHGNDARWLLNKIEKDGLQAAISQATGMFAFGLYDRVEEKVHLVVDRMGEKPLYYYNDRQRFAFASSPAALLHLQDEWTISQEALNSYWHLGAVMSESIWEGIKKVKGGWHLTYDVLTRKTASRRYWAPEFQQNTSGIEDLVTEAIDNVKVSDVPVYIFLSGGIDSSLVASRFKGAHAIHMDGPEYKYARQVAGKFGITLHKVSPGDFTIETSLSDYSLKSGEPTMSGMIPWITSAEASKLCRVAISANGADELFFGYDRTTDRVTDSQLAHIFRPFGHSIDVDPIDERLSSGRWLELQAYVQHDLNRTLDFASMCHSLEVRSPFLDYRLVEMALSIPKAGHGRKEILKGMLRKLGFGDQFLNRPKLGFSLYKEPAGLQAEKNVAVKWCQQRGYLKLPARHSSRDKIYLESSALGFYYWYQTWQHKIKN
jgi:asparagine synthase (glutamine-hydrolysing)